MALPVTLEELVAQVDRIVTLLQEQLALSVEMREHILTHDEHTMEFYAHQKAHLDEVQAELTEHWRLKLLSDYVDSVQK